LSVWVFLGIGFRPIVKQIENIMDKQLTHASNQQQIFKKDKMNNSSGVLSSSRLFLGGDVFFNTKCHFD
jgi:hypothetical protein